MFYLKSFANKDGTRLIYLQFNYRNNKLVISTELSILPAQWDAGAKRPKRSFKYYSHYKARLDKYEDLITRAYLDATMTHYPTPDELKAIVKAGFEEKKRYLHDFAYQLADTKKPQTKLAYNVVAGLIKKFNPELSFDKVDGDLLYDFKQFLFKEGYAQNSAAKIFQRFRSVMYAAVESGLTSNMKFRTKRVAVNNIETTKIFLDELELKAMYQVELTKPGQIIARDAFIVAAFTGVRFSDIWKIDKTSFKGRHFRITAQKENRTIDIPAHPYVLEIMEKYDWKLPKISNVKLNVNIKEVGRLAKIDQMVNIISYPGGVRKDEKKPKYEEITVHSARRSMICNLLLANVPRDVIKSISGHKSDAAFNAYIRLTPQHYLDIAYKSEFFKAKAV